MVTVVEYLFSSIRDKPLDASDVTTLEAARSELARLRKVTYRVCDILNKTSLGAGETGGDPAPAAAAPKKKAHRVALMEDDSHKNYKKVTIPKTKEEKALIREAIGKNLLFKGLNQEDLDEFVDVFEQKRFKKGTTVIQQGDVGETFYVVQEGSLDIFINVGEGETATETQVGVPYGSGGSFGELALLYGSPRAATIRTGIDENCVLWEITRAAYKGLNFIIEKRLHDNKLKALKMVKMGEKNLGEILSNSQLESMALATQYQDFQQGDTIIREGESGDCFYMIVKGSVDVFVKSAGSGKVATLTEHKFFGEKALISSDTRNATCKAGTDVTCLTLTREDFNLMLGNFSDLISGKTKDDTSKLKKYERKKSAKTFDMEDLEKMRVLGEGAFGKVNLVKSKTSGELYALKAQSKAFVVENSQQEHLLTEYEIMRELDHPLVVKCYQAFQDSRYVYFLMNLLPGGELMDLLDSKKKFPEAWTKFYGASVVAGFSCIHEKKIAYRDLKPENLVLDADGFCHIIDFGLAKRCDKGKTWTFCGTPDYLAPEVIRGKGHDWGVDYWGLGVLLYELTHGYTPFYANDPTNTARKIIKGVFPMPSNFSKPLADIIKKLLVEQNKRLGRTQGGCNAIMAHPWFSGFDWDELLNRKIAVPSKPKLGDLEKLGKKDVNRHLADKSDWNPKFVE